MTENPGTDGMSGLARHCHIRILFVLVWQARSLHLALARRSRDSLRKMAPVMTGHRAVLAVGTGSDYARSTGQQPSASVANESETSRGSRLDYDKGVKREVPHLCNNAAA